MFLKSPYWSKRLLIFRKLRMLVMGSGSELVLNDLLCLSIAQTSLGERIYWLEQVLEWLFEGETEKVNTRFKYFLGSLEKNPPWRANFTATLTATLGEYPFLGFFTHVGVAVEHGLWADVLSKLTLKLVPTGGRADLRDMLFNVFASGRSVGAIADLSDENFFAVADLFYVPSDPSNLEAWKNVEAAIGEALLFLSTHIAHYGISSEVRSRIPRSRSFAEISFLRLAGEFHSGTKVEAAEAVQACASDVDAVYEELERTGLSVDVVNRLETITALLDRVRELLNFERASPLREKQQFARSFVVDLIESGLRGRSVRLQIGKHFELLSRKIVERNGHSAEHYIGRTKQERRQLFVSAIGGGFIVVAMTMLKTWVLHLGLAPLFLATGIWIVYAAGFLSMQFTGCTLATKIPSFTASSLASILRRIRKHDAHEFSDEFKLVLKSQGIALLGNLIGVIPLALLINLGLKALTGSGGLMDEEYAAHALHNIHPLLSFAVPLGALTGVELWLSSVAGGWFENWMVFRRLPEGIEYHFLLRRIFGGEFAIKLSRWLSKHASGIATNVALGFLFGFVPVFGGLFGADWNGNHVTISTAGATFAASSLHFELDTMDWIATVAGIALIGLMNFAVSFGLALYVAGKAQRMKFWRMLYYLKR